MKKLLSICLALAMLLVSIPLGAFTLPAEEYDRLCDQTATVRECMDEIARQAGVVYP